MGVPPPDYNALPVVPSALDRVRSEDLLLPYPSNLRSQDGTMPWLGNVGALRSQGMLAATHSYADGASPKAGAGGAPSKLASGGTSPQAQSLGILRGLVCVSLSKRVPLLVSTQSRHPLPCWY